MTARPSHADDTSRGQCRVRELSPKFMRSKRATTPSSTPHSRSHSHSHPCASSGHEDDEVAADEEHVHFAVGRGDHLLVDRVVEFEDVDRLPNVGKHDVEVLVEGLHEMG